MQYDFENVLASLNDQHQMPADIDRLINALTEALDYPAQIITNVLDSQASALAKLDS